MGCALGLNGGFLFSSFFFLFSSFFFFFSSFLFFCSFITIIDDDDDDDDDDVQDRTGIALDEIVIAYEYCNIVLVLQYRGSIVASYWYRCWTLS